MKIQRGKAFILTALVWMLLMGSGVVFAQGVTYDSEEDIMRVSCEDCVSDSEYTLLLLREGASYDPLNEEDIVFIDQLTADGSGNIEAVFVMPAFEACRILLGGAFTQGTASPKLLGSFEPLGRNELNAPAMLRVIEAEAFENAAFTHVYLGEQVTDIKSKAFANCSKLRYIYIPDSASFIADDAFSGCDGFTIGCHEGSAAMQYAVSNGLSYRLVE